MHSCLERDPLRRSTFRQTPESYWHLSTSWRNKIILSAVHRVSSPAMLPVLYAGEKGGGGCRVNHGVMKQNYSGLCQIQICRLISLFTLVFVVWRAMAYRFGNSRRLDAYLLFLLRSPVLVPSFIATLMPWLKQTCFMVYQVSGLYKMKNGRIKKIELVHSLLRIFLDCLEIQANKCSRKNKAKKSCLISGLIGGWSECTFLTLS